MAEPKFDSFAKGQELASKAEHGPLRAVNDELAQMRKLHPQEFSAIIKSMQGANVVHLAEDQQRVHSEQEKRTTLDKWLGRPEPSLTVPKLTIEGDNPKEKFKDPTHVTVAALPNLQITQSGESASKPAEAAGKPAAVKLATGRSAFETGNYPDTALGQEEAFQDIVNPTRNGTRK